MNPSPHDSTAADPIAALRREYSQRELRRADVVEDPVLQFDHWFHEALTAGAHEPNAMCLSTVSETGAPSSRMVLLKSFNADGFVFYTNYESRKGRELADNALACLLFYWPELERQVRVEGRVERVSHETSETYFHSRPRDSQIGAWASDQSRPIASRETLEARQQEAQARFADSEVVPLPDHWGGFRLCPDHIEFWQGGTYRLHDRLVYTRPPLTAESGQPTAAWSLERLQP